MTEVKKPKASLIEKWEREGIACHYVRFHQPVPPAKDMEPVAEFKLGEKAAKYLVDSLVYTPHGLIFKFKEEIDVVPLANVIYARFIA